MGQGMQGTATSVACAGGPPTYCAPTDRAVVPFKSAPTTNVDGTWKDNGPQVGVPWVNNFGQRMVRLTDGLTDPWQAGSAWAGPSFWWGNYCSVFDSSINGYYCTVNQAGGTGGQVMFAINRDTMQSSEVCPSSWSDCNVPYRGFWSSKMPGLMYYTNGGSQICSWNYDSESGSGTCGDGHGTLVYDFAACPAYSTYASSYNLGSSPPQTDPTDTWFGIQLYGSMDAVYNRANGKCYWYNTRYQLVGGTDNSIPVASTMAPGAAPSSFSVAAASGGSIAAGTYYVALSRDTDGNGSRLGNSGAYLTETTPTAAQTVSVPASGEIQVSSIVIPSDVYSSHWTSLCNVYVGTAAGTLFQQAAGKSCTGTITVTSYSTSGQAPLTVSTGGLITHEEYMGQGGTFFYNVADAQANVQPIWIVANSSGVETNTVGVSYAGGHVSAGFNFMFYPEDEPPTYNKSIVGRYDFSTTPMASLSVVSHLLLGPPMYTYNQSLCNADDTHDNWNADDDLDQTPIVVISIVDQALQGGFPLMGIECPFDHEVFGVSPRGDNVVYRFAHANSSTLANSISSLQSNYDASSLPTVTPDGKLALFISDWDMKLGTWIDPGNPTVGTDCYLSCAWAANHSYGANTWIIDSNGNAEVVTTAGTSGSTQPAWRTTSGNTVADGTITWKNYPGCNTSEDVAGANEDTNNGACRADAFAVELH